LEKQKAPDCLNTRKVNTLKEVKNLLQPLEDLTKKISGDKYPTISCMLPLIKCVNSAINQMTPTTTWENHHVQTSLVNYTHILMKLSYLMMFQSAQYWTPGYNNFVNKQTITMYT